MAHSTMRKGKLYQGCFGVGQQRNRTRHDACDWTSLLWDGIDIQIYEGRPHQGGERVASRVIRRIAGIIVDWLDWLNWALRCDCSVVGVVVAQSISSTDITRRFHK